MSTLSETLRAIAETWPYAGVLGFIAVYPLLTGVVWTLTSLLFYRSREVAPTPPIDEREEGLGKLPFVSILVAAYGEEAVIVRTVESLLRVDYPRKEIVVVDDGSPDRTGALLGPYVDAGRIRLIEKRRNEGKAMALNDAIPVLRGEIVLVIDADIQPLPDVLRYIVPHFESARVAAVAGNPQVTNTRSLLAKVQATEFASIVSILRRAQRVWGRILTVSGAVCAFRKSAVVDVGLFDPEMATEDIALTWKLQRRFYDVRYEPRAVVAMQVPESFGALWKQRRRWAFGLAQVLRRNAAMLLDWRTRRLWPVFIEAILSIAWAYAATVMVAFWAISYALGLEPLGAHPVPNFWGMVIASVALVQLGVGIWLDGHYNRGVGRFFLWAAMYPLFYWGLMTIITVLSTPRALLARPGARTSHWKTERVTVPDDAVEATPAAVRGGAAARHQGLEPGIAGLRDR
jgi:poly-beta-1,6-N-acetyl-D-glucosamine synthase